VLDRLTEIFSELTQYEITGDAENISRIFENLNELNPDVVILDTEFSLGASQQIIKNIKENRPDTKVIAISEYPFPKNRQICVKLGADYFFDKFNEIDKIINTLNNFTQRGK
jgi:DNA-binding NarL/FixJ family response regulator